MWPETAGGSGGPDGGITPFIPKGVMLDMDGLMLDTERMEIALYVRISREMGWPTSEAFLRTTVGISDGGAEKIYKAEFGAAYPFREIWERVKDALTGIAETEGIPHRPGLTALLDRLDALGIPKAVATSTERKRALWKLEKAGVADRFGVLVCGDEVRRGKPAPDIFLKAAERLNAAPADCVGFEDSPAGLTGLADAGIRSVFVKDLAEPSSAVLATVWRRCPSLAEAAALFG
ncbi:MAG: HAD family phosphatase [Treponema sp.]|jgi:HAD superfamily hydrolase (TIGR01509 family)|nr:HAD family phosphatase [Treponema sp.]